MFSFIAPVKLPFSPLSPATIVPSVIVGSLVPSVYALYTNPLVVIVAPPSSITLPLIEMLFSVLLVRLSVTDGMSVDNVVNSLIAPRTALCPLLDSIL